MGSEHDEWKQDREDQALHRQALHHSLHQGKSKPVAGDAAKKNSATPTEAEKGRGAPETTDWLWEDV